MSQEMVERVLGRMITDERFHAQASASLETACQMEGYRLSPEELRLLSVRKLQALEEVARQLHPGLCRSRAAGD